MTEFRLRKVMFVDDDEATNAFHKALSADFGLAEHVLIHSRADTALQELSQITDKNEFPELIFVDINMPKLSGHEFSLAVQKLKAYDSSRTCIALLTNSKDIKDVIKADENLVECYYWKPLNGELLEQVLEEGFGNRPPLV